MRLGEGDGWSRLPRAEEFCSDSPQLCHQRRSGAWDLLPLEGPAGLILCLRGAEPSPSQTQHFPAPSRYVIPTGIRRVSAKRDWEKKLEAGQETDAGRDNRQRVHQKIGEDVPSRNSCLKVYRNGN